MFRIARLKRDLGELAISLSSYFPIHIVRIWLLCSAGVSLGSDTVIYHGYKIRSPSRLSIGNDSSIGDSAILDARGGLTIGSSVNFSTGVQIWTAQHDWQSEDFSTVSAPVVIGDHVWIGPRVTILPGAVVENGAVVAAGSVVRGVVSAWSLYAGVPAKHIGDRPQKLKYKIGGRGKKQWWW